MKKAVLAGLAAVMMTIGMAKVANATFVEDTKTFNQNLGKDNEASPYNLNTYQYKWFHLTPSDFQVPYDIVTSATLAITMQRFADGQNTGSVTVEAVNLKPILSSDWSQSGGNSSNQVYETSILDIFASWTGDRISVIFDWNTPDTTNQKSETLQDNYIRLVSSTFTLDYTNGSATTGSGGSDIGGAASPVPEPATMLLFGTGLVGLAGTRLRRKNKS